MAGEAGAQSSTASNDKGDMNNNKRQTERLEQVRALAENQHPDPNAAKVLLNWTLSHQLVYDSIVVFCFISRTMQVNMI